MAGRETGALTSAVAPFSGRCATGETLWNGAGTGDGTNDGAIDAAGTGDSNGGNGEGSHVPGGSQGFGTGRISDMRSMGRQNLGIVGIITSHLWGFLWTNQYIYIYIMECHKLVVSSVFMFTAMPGDMIQFDQDFSNGLKPPTRNCFDLFFLAGCFWKLCSYGMENGSCWNKAGVLQVKEVWYT